MSIQQSISGSSIVTVAQAQALAAEDNSVVKLDFLTGKQIAKLIPTAKAWGAMTLSQQILANNAWSSQLNGEKIMPLAVTKGEAEFYHHGTYLSTIRSFTPLLQSFSGDGKCVGKFDISLNAMQVFTVTVNQCPTREEGEDMKALLKRKYAHLSSVIKLVNGVGAYEVGQVLPNNTELFYLEYAIGVVPGACTDKGDVWDFVVAKKPSISKVDVEWLGEVANATKAQVTIRIPGWYVSVSSAEKFAGVLTKLMVDPMPLANKLEDLTLGSVLMYETTEGTPINSGVTSILDGTVTPCPHPLVYTGQETSKGAPTAPIAAAALHAMTGKYVSRPVTNQHQQLVVNGSTHLHDLGEVTWDEDEFVDFRKAWNEASIHWAIIVKWIPTDLFPVFNEAVGGNSSTFQFVPYQGDYLVFHKCEVRAELAPLTMETSTMSENNKTARATGSLFSELIQIISKVGDPTIAKVLYATGWKSRQLADMVLSVGQYRTVSRDEAMELKVTCVDPLTQKIELPANPQQALLQLARVYGDVFWLPTDLNDGEDGFLVSPLLATKLGLAPGAQLNLYAKVMYDIAVLLNNRLVVSEDMFGREYSQAVASHNKVVALILKGSDNESVSSILANTTRASNVWSSKVGACIFKGADINGLHVSSDHALASKQGSYHLLWRNPMAFILGLRVVVVGPATEACPNPTIVTEEQILGSNKVYLYPTTWYRTAGDVDGDMCQGVNLTWLMGTWVTNKVNHAALKAVGVFKTLFAKV